MNSRFVYLWPFEWETLCRYAATDKVIVVRRRTSPPPGHQVVGEGTNGANIYLETEPGISQSFSLFIRLYHLAMVSLKQHSALHQTVLYFYTINW